MTKAEFLDFLGQKKSATVDLVRDALNAAFDEVALKASEIEASSDPNEEIARLQAQVAELQGQVSQLQADVASRDAILAQIRALLGL